ncbi:hypothetical protein VKT23_002593 [Stygiomarasmius scandens]|uniref:Uncharacterized protein n=1 Tax=Marasmiellus scandens TaxID=2682957 RepID=A0ABR1K804_9AGAR
MQCNWFARASCFSRSFSSANAIKATPTSFTTCLASRTTLFHRQASSIPSHASPTPSPHQKLTPAKASRASANAIRIALENRDIESAFIVAHAVRASNGSLPAHEGTRKYVTDAAVTFPFAVPARLSMHALLHGLLRQGLVVKAYRHAQLMLQAGIPIRSKTLEIVIEESLAQGHQMQPLRNHEFFLRMKELLPSSHTKDLLHLHPSSAHNPGVRRAITILQAARNYKQARTDRMFGAVIRACLLQGELLAATLIFVAIVKDFAVKDALLKQLHLPTISETPDVEKLALNHFRNLRTVSPGRPGSHLLKDILTSISEVLSREVGDEEDKISRQVALQSLAFLAVILDLRQLPCEASPLIKALYSCPRADNEVWVLVDGRNKRVKAYDYFHAVLKRHIDSLPGYNLRDDASYIKGLKVLDRKLPDWSPSFRLTRPLSRESGNALLHYALRHRFSPLLGNKVIEYLEKDPKHTKVNAITYNTILTAGRVLRAPYMAEEALNAMRRSGNPRFDDRHPSLPVNMDRTDGERDTRFTRALKHLRQDRLKVPPLPNNAQITPDSYTIVAYISYLTATGRPHIVADALFEYLPELAAVSHPSWDNLSRRQVNILKRQSTNECLRRAVAYGPHVFVALLNALYKAGRTGLAERVWFLAKKAERRSWNPYLNRYHPPWVLPVEAYTIMIQVYSREAKKTPLMMAKTLQNESKQIHWSPRQNRFVVGWARYLYRIAEKRQKNLGLSQDEGGKLLSRSSVGRDSALGVYNGMLRAVYHVYASLKKVLRRRGLDEHMAKLDANLQLPAPDPRFFNAMLSITTYHPMMRRRRARTSPAHWRQHIRFANWLYAKFGIPRAFNNVHLKELAQDIVDAGHELPIGVQYLLVGRGGIAMRRGSNAEKQNETEDGNVYKTPWAFSRPSKQLPCGPFMLQTYKRSGLPLGRRPRRTKRYHVVRRGNTGI